MEDYHCVYKSNIYTWVILKSSVLKKKKSHHSFITQVHDNIYLLAKICQITILLVLLQPVGKF